VILTCDYVERKFANNNVFKGKLKDGVPQFNVPFELKNSYTKFITKRTDDGNVTCWFGNPKRPGFKQDDMFDGGINARDLSEVYVSAGCEAGTYHAYRKKEDDSEDESENDSDESENENFYGIIIYADGRSY